jgi:uncharacterized YigZ family protein
MSDDQYYNIPAQPVEVTTEIKRSRFIARIEHCSNEATGFEIIAQVKQQYPDARHHCWAFIACAPQSATSIRFSDDGEPSGTAGKPILNVLQHSDYGEIICVVSRYFGGIKLGAGGLVRAYSNSCQAAVDQLTSRLVMPMLRIKIQFPFSYESSIRHYLDSQQVMISNVTYSDQVLLELCVEKNKLGSVLSHTNNLCKGDMIQLTTN